MNDQTYQTDNVVIHLTHDRHFNQVVLECDNYAHFVECMRKVGIYSTNDNVAWNDSGIDTDYLDEYIQELKRD